MRGRAEKWGRSQKGTWRQGEILLLYQHIITCKYVDKMICYKGESRCRREGTSSKQNPLVGVRRWPPAHSTGGDLR